VSARAGRRRLDRIAAAWLAAALLALPGLARADAADTTAAGTPLPNLVASSAVTAPPPARTRASGSKLEHLNPSLADDPYTLAPGPRPFLKRLAVSPGVGWVGGQRLYVIRAAYNPNRWLAYEASLGHNPGASVQALYHMLSVIVRRPLPGRFQPYAAVGYGLTLVFPGRAVNAAPATENTFSWGGGLEIYLRDDLAVRTEMRGVTVLGGSRERSGTVVYGYREATFGLSFYRTLGG
jgi:opacity protein-like surface antigen